MTETDEIYAGIQEYDSFTADVSESCDVVVVGSGPTGAVAAYNLADAGLDVILLEAGPVRRPSEFTNDGGRTMAEVCYEGGLRVMRGESVLPTMQARLLGGGSHINSAICVRTPDFCFDDWKQNWGVDTIDRNILDPHYDRVEAFLGIGPTPPEALGRKNELFRDACDALGYHSEPMPRNVVGCCGCAECFTGCPTRAKKSMEISYIPAAIKKGLRVMTSLQVREVLQAGGRAAGVAGNVVHPRTNKATHQFRINARATILAAGCLATPVLLKKSKVADPYDLIGRDLQAHPGAAIMGIFDEVVDPWVGATQGYQSLEFIEQGFKMEVLWAPPEVLSVRFPDFGHTFKSHLASLKHSALWDAFFALKKSRGRVRARPGKSMNPDITYRIDPSDMPVIQEGMATISDMFFAAGATHILPGINKIPKEIHRREDVDLIRTTKLTPGDLVLASTHLFSTTRMGGDPRNAVVDGSGQMHHLADCYIVDTGIMPRSPAVNPMLTGMAMADLLGQEIAGRYK